MVPDFLVGLDFRQIRLVLVILMVLVFRVDLGVLAVYQVVLYCL